MPDYEKALRDAAHDHDRARGDYYAAVLAVKQAVAVERAAAVGAQRVAVAAATEEHDRAVAMARRRSARIVDQLRDRMVGCRQTLAGGSQSPTGVADHIDLGAVVIPGSGPGNDDVDAPALLPFIGRSNLLVVGPDVRDLVQRIVLSAIEGTAPGQLDVVGYDPRLTSWLSAFAKMREAASESLVVVSRQDELEDVLAQLADRVQKVNDAIQGADPDLLAHARRVGHAVSRWTTFVLLDFPADVGEDGLRLLRTLAQVGPPAGISLLVASSSSDSDGVREITDHGSWEILRHGTALTWDRAPGSAIRLSEAAGRLRDRADAAARRALEAAGPLIDFADVEDLARPWQRSSRDGFAFVVGRQGAGVAEILLGDSRTQRHNVLVTGAVGQGKSNLLKVIIHSIATRYSPEEVALYLLDFKDGVTLYPMGPRPGAPDYLPHARVLGLESDREFGLAVLRELSDERERRSSTIKPHGDDIAAFRRKNPGIPMPRIVLVIDEFHRLLEPSDDAVATESAALLESLARLGRAAGIHLVLASQTITGIRALVTREDGLYSQFPVRLALKNSLSESHATFTIGNDAAARLRFRGELAMNLDYGAVGANATAIVPVAADEVMAALRRRLWEQRPAGTRPPAVFDGGAPSRLRESLDAVADLRRLASAGEMRRAVIGRLIAIGNRVAAAPMSAAPGRNLAVLGAGEKASTVDCEGMHLGIGILQSAATSLALQHPGGDAKFVAIDLLPAAMRKRNRQDDWIRLMGRLGFEPRTVGASDLPRFLYEAAAVVSADEPSTTTYIIGFGLDLAGNLNPPDMFAQPPVDDLRTVLRDGPRRGWHVLGWWGSPAVYTSHLGFPSDGLVDSTVFLRTTQQTVNDVLGSWSTEWSARDLRGLWMDATELAAPTTVVPFGPLVRQDSEEVERYAWS